MICIHREFPNIFSLMKHKEYARILDRLKMDFKGNFFGTPCRLYDQISHTSNIAHVGIVMVGIKRPKRVSL